MNPNDPQFGQLGGSPAPAQSAGQQPLQGAASSMGGNVPGVDVYGSAHTQAPAPQTAVYQPAMQQPAQPQFQQQPQPPQELPVEDAGFGGFGSLPAQPHVQSQSTGLNQAQSSQVLSTVQPQITPSAIAESMLMTPQDEDDLFGKEKLSLTTKILIVGAVIAALGSVVAVGLWLYSTYIRVPQTGSTPNGVPAANANVNKASSTQDTDGDGLTDADEKKYGSDPKKSDTDGDGFSDSSEVKNGYNPAGPGKLQ